MYRMFENMTIADKIALVGVIVPIIGGIFTLGYLIGKIPCTEDCSHCITDCSDCTNQCDNCPINECPDWIESSYRILESSKQIIADINGDNEFDLIIVGRTEILTRLSIDGQLQEERSAGISYEANAYESHDNVAEEINGDGISDIVFYGSVYKYGYESRANGTFGPRIERLKESPW